MTAEHHVPGTPRLLYLGPAEVERALGEIDVLDVVARALVAHAHGETVLPDEAYLPWTSPAGASARSLNMPAGLSSGRSYPQPVYGTKIINATLDNPDRGLPRAGGLTLLFDPVTARPCTVLAAARISALRTAAVSALAVRELARPGARTLTVIGAGALADAHLHLLAPAMPNLDQVLVCDTAPQRAEELAQRARDRGLAAKTASVQDAVRSADVLVTATTVTQGYIPLDWLAPGCTVCHVSLDDLLPDALLEADVLVIDDWQLVATDRRRILGRLIADGRVRRHDDPGTGRVVDAELGQVLSGQHPGRTGAEQRIVVNPFGMALEDVALAHEVATHCRNEGRGQWLDFE